MNRFVLLIVIALTNPISTGRIHAEIDILNAAEKEVSVLHVSLVMVCGDSGQRSGTYDASNVGVISPHGESTINPKFKQHTTCQPKVFGENAPQLELKYINIVCKGGAVLHVDLPPHTLYDPKNKYTLTIDRPHADGLLRLEWARVDTIAPLSTRPDSNR